jgi:hypothetical protein
MSNQQEARLSEATDPGSRKTLRVRVVDNSKQGHPAVNIRVPIGVVEFGMKMAQAVSPEARKANLDWDSIGEMIDAGELGKIVDVEDEAEHRTIEVWIESYRR